MTPTATAKPVSSKSLYWVVPGISTLVVVTILFLELAPSTSGTTPTDSAISSSQQPVEVFPTIVFPRSSFHTNSGQSGYFDQELELQIDTDYEDQGGYKTTSVIINSDHFHLDIANDPMRRTLGLGRREPGDPHKGMLFIFPTAAKHGFWMKDMKFAIDIIWLDEQRQVVDITYNVAPDTYPQVFEPEQDAKYVIEVPTGTWSLETKHPFDFE